MNRVTLALLLPVVAVARAGGAQRVAPRRREFWYASAAALTITIPLDERIREFAVRHQSATLHGIATTIGDAGAPHVVIPLLLAGAVVPRMLGDPATANALSDIAWGYATTLVAGTVARRVVGRHRPDSAGHPERFSPFHAGHEWHSFPSGHAIGVMALATGISIKANRPWVAITSYSLASLVGLQRLYDQKHWASDVIAGTVFGIAASASTVRWREHLRTKR